MKKYFYTIGEEKFGPFELDDLKNHPIEPDTLIWFQGLETWQKASEISEMKSVLELKPPEINTDKNDDSFSRTESEDSILIKEPPKQQNSDFVTNNGKSNGPFSFDGRIGRSTYFGSFVIFLIAAVFLNAIVESGEATFLALANIPLYWFLWAQGAKRCHDLGNSGWYQIIPFYVLWMIFAPGNKGSNEYGTDPSR